MVNAFKLITKSSGDARVETEPVRRAPEFNDQPEDTISFPEPFPRW